MLKILQARLQQYINRELPDVQAGFRKGKETRDQIANIHWIIKKAKVFQKNTENISKDNKLLKGGIYRHIINSDFQGKYNHRN